MLTGQTFFPQVLSPEHAALLVLPACSLERVGHLDRAAVASLCALKALTALTIITATDAAADVLQHTAAAAAQQQHQHQQQQQQQQQLEAEGGEAVVAVNAALGAPDAVAAPATPTVSIPAAAAAAADGGNQGLWLPLLELPLLQELVLGSAHRSQQLHLTGNLTAKLQSSVRVSMNSGKTSASPGFGGGSICSSGGRGRAGHGGCCWYQQSNEAVSAYVCPTGAWSDLSNVKVGAVMRLAAVNKHCYNAAVSHHCLTAVAAAGNGCISSVDAQWTLL
jgi:hypothetical protein